MKEMKRVLSLILCLVMIVGLLPMGVLRAEAAEGETHYLAFATDRHGEGSIIAKVLSNMESQSGGNIEYVGLGGDMTSDSKYNTSTLLTEVNNGVAVDLTAAYVDVTKGSHDGSVNDDYGMFHSSSEQLIAEDEYYVYGIVQADMENTSAAQTAAGNFVTWANAEGMDTSRVIIVLSHMSLHDYKNRKDNVGATYWHNALNSVADPDGDGVVDRDVVFFHGHNHSQDSALYNYNIGDSITLRGTTSSSSDTVSGTVYYTYATAGYLKASQKASLVTITDTTVTVARYGTSGSGTTLATVKRVAEPVTLKSIAVNAEAAKTAYTVGEEFTSEGLVVTAYYSDETFTEVTDYTVTGYDMATAGTQTLTVTYEGLTAQYDITVSEAEKDEEEVKTPASIAAYTEYAVTAFAVGEEFSTEGLVVTAYYEDGTSEDVTGYTVTGYDMETIGTQTVTVTYAGLTAQYDITVGVFYSDDMFAAVHTVAPAATAVDFYEDEQADALLSYWYGYEFSLEGEDAEASVLLWLEPDVMSSDDLAVYHYNETTGEYELVSADAYTVAVDADGFEYITIPNAAMGSYIYGIPVAPETAVLAGLTLVEPEKLCYYDTDAVEEMINGELQTVIYLDITGMEVTANYADGDETYTRVLEWNNFNSQNDGYALSFDGLTPGAYGPTTVTVSYGDASISFTVYVCAEEMTVGNVNLKFSAPSVMGMTVEPVEVTDAVNIAVTDLLKTENLALFDFSPVYPDIVKELQGEAEITMPIPAGIVNPLVCYIPESGKPEVMETTNNGDGTLTFTTSHFSTFAVGENMMAGVEEDATVPGSGYTNIKVATPVTVYKLVSSIQSGKQYLIVSDDDGSGYGLDGDTSGYATTAFTGGSDYYSSWDDTNKTGTAFSAGSDVYLTTSGAYLWTVGSGYTFTNGSASLGYSGGLSFTTKSNWEYDSNNLTTESGSSFWSTTYYLRCRTSNGTWSTNSSKSSTSTYTYDIYFYEPVTIYQVTETVTGTQDATYGIDITLDGTATQGIDAGFIQENDTLELGTAFTSTVSGQTPGANGTYTWTSSNTNVATVDSNGIVTFTGNAGTTLIQVSYTWTQDGISYTVSNYTSITASKTTYKVEITNGDSHVEKGVNDKSTEQLTAQVSVQVDEDTWEPVENAVVTWTILEESDSDIAEIDENGLLSFTGKEGVIYVQANYNGFVDIITVTARKSTGITPGESTTDFPRWPNEGAVRFDKTASAVGNFSETGIAQVELSLAGIPVKTGGAVDVVIMLDMTGSMSTAAMAAAEESAIAFAEQIVKKKGGGYTDSRIAVLAFNSKSTSPFTYWELGTVSDDDEWAELCKNVRGASDDKYSGGTPYDEALEKCQQILNTAKSDEIGKTRQQFCVFVSDGGPTSYKYITNYDAVKEGTATTYTTATATATGGSNQSDSNFKTIAGYTHEYYSTLMKDDGITVYTVLTGLTAADYPNCTTIMRNIATEDAKAYVVEDGTDTSAITGAFTAIAEEINAAATNVNVEDVVTDEYSIIFELPNQNIANAVPDGQEFFIEVVEYPLNDTTHERTGESKILQRIYLDGNSISRITYTNDAGTVVAQELTPVYTQAKSGEDAYFDDTGKYYPEGNGTHHMTSGATISGEVGERVLHTPNFTYVEAEKKLNWTITSMSETAETALRYFVYLRDSGGVPADQQIDADTYPTNVYANLTYTNYKGNECEQEFPIPQMTWNGAQVSYVFYLVNEAGKPVNRAGREVTFAEAIFVTDVHTFEIVWNDLEQAAGLEAEYLARGLLPEDYELYDQNASYKIHVYENETGSNLNNHFILSGTPGDTTTYVYNVKTDINKYNTHGTYAANSIYLCKSYNVTATVEDGEITAATFLGEEGATQMLAEDLYSTTNATILNGYVYYIDENGDVYTIIQKTRANKLTDFDFANTTVAFAVVWEQKLVEDTVVVDFGLPVDIDVVENDFVYNYISGISAKDPGYGINTGYKTEDDGTNYVPMGTDALKIQGHTVTIKDENNIRFTPGTMEFNGPVKFYYETVVEVYENNEVIPSHMYSSVTVIPATTIYYEDEFVTLKTWDRYSEAEGVTADNFSEGTYYVKNGDGYVEAAEYDQDATYYTQGAYTDTPGWKVKSKSTNQTQAVDRPGANQISKDYDADNNYGYDEAYVECSTYSMENAAMTQVINGVNYATAEFSFYGTGFDVISMASDKTGTIVVQVSGPENKNFVVDTYFGYKYDPNQNRDNNGDKKIDSADFWVPTKDDATTLYQVPVIKVENLKYGKYTVTITASHAAYFDHEQYDGSKYDFYLDAIRIYDPAGKSLNDLNEVVKDAYAADGELLPNYYELRNMLIDGTVAKNLTQNAIVNGIVFIDGNKALSDDTAALTDAVTDYANYGPNNELYLAPGQAVAFLLNASAEDGIPEGYVVDQVQIAYKGLDKQNTKLKLYNAELSADKATTLDVNTATDLYYDITYLDGHTVVIANAGEDTDGLLSITNIKVTYKLPDAEEQQQNDATAVNENVFSVTKNTTNLALASLFKKQVTIVQPVTQTQTSEPEATEPVATEPEVTQTEEKTEKVQETKPQSNKPQESKPQQNKAGKAESQVKNSVVEVAQKAEHVKTAIEKAAGYISDALSRWF